VPRNHQQFLVDEWGPSCYSCFKPSEWMNGTRTGLWLRQTGTDIRNGLQSHGGDRKIFKVMISASLLGTLGSVFSLLTASFYQGKHYRNHMIHNINLPTPVKAKVYHHHWRSEFDTNCVSSCISMTRSRLIIVYWYSCF
jgi:hypothetical protein